jgi:hypothetical protein
MNIAIPHNGDLPQGALEAALEERGLEVSPENNDVVQSAARAIEIRQYAKRIRDAFLAEGNQGGGRTLPPMLERFAPELEGLSADIDPQTVIQEALALLHETVSPSARAA